MEATIQGSTAAKRMSIFELMATVDPNVRHLNELLPIGPEDEESAIEAAFHSEDIKTENIETWETHRQIYRGNVFGGELNEAYAQEA